MVSARLKSVLHFVCYIGRWYGLGATQMTKSVVLADIVSFCARRKTISGTKLVKAPRGPVPDGYQDALNELVREGAIHIIPQTKEYETTRFEVLAAPALDGFDAEDTAILDTIVRAVCNKYTATALSDLTHNEIWKLSDMGEEIPLAAYFPRQRIPATPERISSLKGELVGMGYEFV